MELNVRLEGNVNQGLQPVIFKYPSEISASPQVKQQDTEKTKAEPEKKKATSEQDTKTAIEQGNKLMELFHRDLRFEMHKEANVVKISIVDRESGKVIKQIPPESVLNMIARIRDVLGSLMDVKA